MIAVIHWRNTSVAKHRTVTGDRSFMAWKKPHSYLLLSWPKANLCKKADLSQYTAKAFCLGAHGHMYSQSVPLHRRYLPLLAHNLSQGHLLTAIFHNTSTCTGRWPDSSPVIRCLLLSSLCLTFIECPVERKQGEEKQCNFVSPIQLGHPCIPYFTAPYLSSSA